jgi:hypothetical protein
MELKRGDRVIIRYNMPSRDLGLRPGLEGIATGELTYSDDRRTVRWWNIEWPHEKWWIPESQIKRIKS